MPVVLLERVPLPNLRTYTAVSVCLLACAIYYARQVVLFYEEERELNIVNTGQDGEAVSVNTFPPPALQGVTNVSNITDDNHIFLDTVAVLFQEAWCIWTLINMAFCCLILMGKGLQKLVFGELRVSELQHIKDRFWNFLFYKFIFIFGVMNVQNMDEVFAWTTWFAVIGFLHLMSQLCKDRFEYLSFSPTTPTWMHAKVLSLLVVIEVSVIALAVFCIFMGFHASLNTAAFMIAECILLAIKCLYVILRYAIHLWDLHHEGVWENRALYVYYSEFVFEMMSLTIDFLHHLHMLLWGNIFLSMASLVICMQLRFLFHELQRRLRRHQNYRRVVTSMQARFPMAEAKELDENNDDCAICWDRMDAARKLPCGHLFHNSCLRSWLEQDTSCPTCRLSLSDPQEGQQTRQQPVAPDLAANQATIPPTGTQQPIAQPNTQFFNHFFHFDGSRYVSWLPSFSVEVTHTNILGNHTQHVNTIQTSQLDNMARQVQELFPSMPSQTILDDLTVTRSVELTIENILEGRLQAPPSSTFSTHQPSSTSSQEQESSETSNDSSEGSSSNSSSGESTPLVEEVVNEEQEEINQNHLGLERFRTEISQAEEEDVIINETPARYVEDSDLGCASGFRFSKSSAEREEMLSSRKEAVLEHARRKYLAKRNGNPFPSQDCPGECGDEFTSQAQATAAGGRQQLSMPATEATLDEAALRRERAFQAARRRMQNSERQPQDYM